MVELPIETPGVKVFSIQYSVAVSNFTIQRFKNFEAVSFCTLFTSEYTKKTQSVTEKHQCGYYGSKKKEELVSEILSIQLLFAIFQFSSSTVFQFINLASKSICFSILNQS